MEDGKTAQLISKKKTMFPHPFRCVDARARLPTHDQAVRSQTDRNMKLTGALRRTSRFLENSTVAKEVS